MKKQKSFKLGIVGGLGALAGADLLYRIVKQTAARAECEHREFLFEQKPMLEPKSPLDPKYNADYRKLYVFDTLSKMESEGCDVALLPCFISHSFIGDFERELDLYLVNIFDAILAAVNKRFPLPKKVGIVTTPYIRKAKLFDKILSDKMEILYPNEKLEENVMFAIYGKEGFKTSSCETLLIKELEAALLELNSKGASLFIPGITELALVTEKLSMPANMSFLDTTSVYADYALTITQSIRESRFKIGIVGGVGPAATIDFMSKIVSGTTANSDQDHIKMIVEHNPQIPDRTENIIGQGADPTLSLYSTCKKLEKGGANIIAIPCNTAHAFLNQIQPKLTIPVINILTATVNFIKDKLPSTKLIGLMATSGTLRSGLYQGALNSADLDYIIPDEERQELVMNSIYGDKGVKAGYSTGICKEQILSVIKHLAGQGADIIILGCTELPIIVNSADTEFDIFFVDPTEILANTCIALAQKNK